MLTYEKHQVQRYKKIDLLQQRPEIFVGTPAHPFLAGDQVPADKDDAVLVPGVVRPPDAAANVVEHVAVVEPGGQSELLAQLLHPLPDQVPPPRSP